MIPLRDEHVPVRIPFATYILIAANLAAWLLVQGAGSEIALMNSFCVYGLIPGELLGLVPQGSKILVGENMVCVLDGSSGPVTLLTHAFLHGSWFHLISNLWFLWIFGDNVEDAMGPFRFVAYYLACALAAAAAQIATDPAAVVPMVGASGAIGGVMGGYARLYPRARIITLIPFGFFFTTAALPAFLMLGYWFLIQLLSGIPALSGPAGGVAFWAHVGGFVAGLILVGPFHRRDYLAEHLKHQRRRPSRLRF